ncbi:hypothetical protein C8R43DRAFT_250168 [Mycena crocata]|nr:hypothetical protein C8R43DRAFT_250168 [Mycena crocata]
MPSCEMTTPLDMLADTAAKCTLSYTNDSSHAAPRCSLNICRPKLQRAITPGGNACGLHHLRPRKRVHAPHKSSRLHTKPKTDLKVRRKELMDRACTIKSLENSPVNEQQLFVLRTVYDEITMYPTDPWVVLMSIILHRSLRQIKNWFSNERQKNKWGDVVATQTDMGERLRLRPSATELCGQWSDAFFEEVLMIVNFRTARRLQWERTQATTDLTVMNFNEV